MKFQFLNKDLWPIATGIVKNYGRKKYKNISCEKSFKAEYAFRPTLICKKGRGIKIIEIQPKPNFHETFEQFVKDCLLNRERVEIYLAFLDYVDDKEISFSHSFMRKIREYGVGIILIGNNSFLEYEKAVRCNMRITRSDIENSRKHRYEIGEISAKFNRGDFIDAIRDLTELFEAEIDVLIESAAKKRKIVPTTKNLDGFDLEKKINCLSSPKWGEQKQKRYFDNNLSNDAKSFKGARNLSHHPRTIAEQMRLEDQCYERMHTGIRLFREFSKIKV